MPSYGNKPLSGGEGKPKKEIYASLIERHYNCCCTWEWREGLKTFILKYRHVLCPASAWHRQIGG